MHALPDQAHRVAGAIIVVAVPSVAALLLALPAHIPRAVGVVASALPSGDVPSGILVSGDVASAVLACIRVVAPVALLMHTWTSLYIATSSFHHPSSKKGVDLHVLVQQGSLAPGVPL